MEAPRPANEAERLAALRRYAVLDTPNEEAFDRLTKLAARVFNVPIVLVSLVDERRQWFKGCYGLDVRETGRELSFCAYAILSDEVFVVGDAPTDPRFADNALVTGAPHIRFYAGAPLKTPEGLNLGSLCLIDTQPREFNDAERATLAELAAMAVDALELRVAATQLREEAELFDLAHDAIIVRDPQSRVLFWNRGAERIYGWTREEALGEITHSLLQTEFPESRAQVDATLQGEGIWEGELIHSRKDGARLTVSSRQALRRGARGEPSAVIEINSDITERKRAEEKLAASERELRDLVENATDLIYRTDASGHFSFVNPVAPRLMRCLATDLIGKHYLELVHPDHRSAAERFYSRQLLRGTESTYYEFPALACDGTVVWLGQHVRLIVAEGEPTGFEAVARDITQRRAVEEERTALADRIRLLLESTSEGICGIDMEGRCTFVNNSAAAITGFKPEELLGRNLHNLVHHHRADGSFYPGEECPMYQALSKGEPVQRENEVFWRKDGSSFPVAYASAPVIENGIVRGGVVTFSDITQRKRNEARLHLLESTVVNARDAVLITEAEPVDLPGPRIIYVNRAFEQMSGYSAEEVLGNTPRMLQGPESDRAALDKVRAALKTWQPVQVELINYHKDGTKFWVELSIVPVADETGWFTHWVSIQRDITARKEAEETLRQSEEQFRSVVEGVQDYAIIRLDAAGHVTTWNDGAEKIKGYAAEEILGSHVSRFYTEEDVRAGRPEALLQRAVEQGRAEDEGWRLRKDGTRYWANALTTALHDEHGKLSGFSKVTRDITERKQVEEALVRAKEEADRANMAKSEFLSRMSHELRTPLNAILGFGQLLALDPLSDEQQRGVGLILKGGQHLLGLINEILDLARIEAGEMHLSPEAVRVRQVAAETLELVRPLAAQRGIQLHLSADPECSEFIMADRQRLQQVLLNLLSNAIKYNRDGGSVRIECHASGEARLRIEVRDTGPGIAPEKLERLFVPFDRLGAEHTRIEGTGLGLALSRRLIEAMDGSIGVTSVVGGGSTFAVDLPLADDPIARAEQAAASESLSVTDAGQRTVLYIEDNLSNLELVVRILSRRPHIRLISAMQGGLGLDLARQHQPDLIFLDMHLPDLSGHEVLLRLKAEERLRDIPVVVVSADATTGQIARLKSAGASDYLTKPIDVKQFLALTDQVLANSPT